MADIVQTTDFTVPYFIPQNVFSNLQAYLDKFEPKYLRELLGDELYLLFKADVSGGEPQTQIYIDIFEPLQIQIGCEILQSEGMKELLKAVIYFEYIRDTNFQNTMMGQVQQNAELSNPAKPVQTNLFKVYNDAIASFKAIREYILQNKDIYPTFSGIEKSYIIFY